MPLLNLYVDPNVVYLVVVLGLWFSVTAVYVPGTTLIEGLALVVLAGAALLLLQMPTNWVALLTLILGVLGFIVIPFLKTEIAWLAVGGLALQGVGALFLFANPPVSPVLIGVTLLIQFAYHTFVLMPLLRRIRADTRPPFDRDAQLIGMTGRVVKGLNPVGTVQVNGELWTASADEPLESGEVVVVVDRVGLQLLVESAGKRKRETLNGHYEEEMI